MSTAANYDQVKTYTRQMREYKHTTMSANYVNPELLLKGYGIGAMPSALVPELKAAAELADSLGTRVYVVYSYATPVAWAVRNDVGGVTIWSPEYRYSTTTPKHQTYARGALATAH